MKIVIFLFALTIPLLSGIMFTGYQSSNARLEAYEKSQSKVGIVMNSSANSLIRTFSNKIDIANFRHVRTKEVIYL
jgi:hypothetical protein